MYEKEISIVHGCVCRHMITALISVRGFSGGYDYRSVEVKGTEFTSVAGAFDLYGCWATKHNNTGIVGVIIKFSFRFFYCLSPFTTISFYHAA